MEIKNLTDSQIDEVIGTVSAVKLNNIHCGGIYYVNTVTPSTDTIKGEEPNISIIIYRNDFLEEETLTYSQLREDNAEFYVLTKI